MALGFFFRQVRRCLVAKGRHEQDVYHVKAEIDVSVAEQTSTDL
jgi:hypothetical protein